MKHKTKNILRAIAGHWGLTVKFVDYLKDDKHGLLLPSEKRILINARKPRCEHVYTLLHEFGHYAIHVKQSAPRMYERRYLNRRWSIHAIAAFATRLRRTLRYMLNRESGREWEADLWAMCAFVYLKRYVGRSDLTAFLNRHPEKRRLFWLASAGAGYCEMKKRLVAPWQLLTKAVQN